jgi:hypothetical protein
MGAGVNRREVLRLGAVALVSGCAGRTSLAENPNDNGGWQGYGRIAFTVV